MITMINYILFGLLAGVYMMLGLIFIWKRQRTMPYRLAFGCTMLMGAIVMTIEVTTMIIYGPVEIQKQLCILADMLIIPMFVFEVICIINQDLDQLPWILRIRNIGILEAPIVVLTILFATTRWEWIGLIAPYCFVTYMLLAVWYILVKLHHYEKRIRAIKGSAEQSIRWAWLVFMLIVVQVLTYLLTEGVFQVLYYPISIVCLLVHAYYIGRQKPADTTRLYRDEKFEEERQKAIDELKDITHGMKRRMDIDTHLAAFRVEHLGFERKLQSMTETRLTKRDYYLCILIYEGQKTNELSRTLAISPTSVEVARHRLRSKLGLEKGVNLTTTIREIIG